MSEAELHVLRARLDGGIRNKAARGELRRGLPVGLVWGEADGEVLLDPDEAIRGAITVIFERFAELGSVAPGVAVAAPRGRPVPACSRYDARRDPLGRAELPPDPQRAHEPRLRRRLRVRQDAPRALRRRARPAAQADPSPAAGRLGGLDLGAPPRLHRPATFEANQRADRAQHAPARARGRAARSARAPRCCKGSPSAGAAGASSRCTTRAAAATRARPITARAACWSRAAASWCLRVGGSQIDEAVAGALLAALTPAGVKAALRRGRGARARSRRRAQAVAAAGRARPISGASAPSGATAPSSPSTASSRAASSATGSRRSRALAAAEAELALREHQRPRTLTPAEREQLLALGADLGRVWSAPTTTDRDRKQLLRCLIEEVILDVAREQRRATLTIRWRGGAITELAVALPRHQPAIRTDEDTIALLERLAAHYDDATIAGILNRQGRRSRHRRALHRDHRRRAAPLPRHPRPPAARRRRPTASCSRSARPPTSSASPPPPCTAGSRPASSAASRTLPARPGGSASTTSSARCSSKTRPAGYVPMRRRDAHPRRLPPDRLAACQARRTRRHPRPPRTPKRPANPRPRARNRALRHHAP